MTFLAALCKLCIVWWIARSAKVKKSLSVSGAIAGFVLLGLIFLCSWYHFMMMMVFFSSASKVTKLKPAIKKKREEDYKTEGQRNVYQVLANGGLPCVLSVLMMVQNPLGGWIEKMSLFGDVGCFNLLFVGVMCCNAADTFASEVGILSRGKPRFVLPPFPIVAHGTNGGVSSIGYFAAAMAGLMFGVFHLLTIFLSNSLGLSNPNLDQLTFHYCFSVIFTFFASALFGTTMDSILGAVFEYSGWDETRQVVVKNGGKKISGLGWMSGNQVNFLAGLMTGLFCLGTFRCCQLIV